MLRMVPPPRPGEDLLALLRHHRHRPAILAPGTFVMAFDGGAFLAPAYRLHPRRGDAARLEIVARRIGAAIAEREIIFAGAALVGMAFDGDADRGVAGEPGGLSVERGAGLGVERIGIGLEK